MSMGRERRVQYWGEGVNKGREEARDGHVEGGTLKSDWGCRSWR